MSEDLYTLLEVDRGASFAQVRRAYRRLARAYHPDRNAAPDAADRFKAVAAAYAVLSDAVRRETYDRTGRVSNLDRSITGGPDAREESAFE